MPPNPDNPLAILISTRLDELGWSNAELVRQLADRGVAVTPSGVHYWRRGAGVAENKRAALADALDVPLSQITSACLRRATGSP